MDTTTGFNGDGSGYQYLTPEQQATFEQLAVAVQNEYSRRVASGEPWVLPEVALAQIGVETGYNPDYMPGNMCFGVKAGPEIPEEKRQYLLTTEYDDYGNPYQTTAAFRKYDSYEESISDYFDMLATAGYYDGAIRNPDANEAFNIICPFYATGPDYINSCLSMAETYNLAQFNNTVPTNYLNNNGNTSHKSQNNGSVTYYYSRDGYDEGCNDYDILKKDFNLLNSEIKGYESHFKDICTTQAPNIDYKSITKFDEMIKIVESLTELLEKTKNIADLEKEIGEAYDKSDGGLSASLASTLALNSVNYSIDSGTININDMIEDYKANGVNTTFSNWFDEYITKNGIKSNVVYMPEYLDAIKNTGAVKSDNYVVSKLADYLNDSDNVDESFLQNENNQNNSTKDKYYSDESGGYYSGEEDDNVSTKENIDDSQDTTTNLNSTIAMAGVGAAVKDSLNPEKTTDNNTNKNEEELGKSYPRERVKIVQDNPNQQVSQQVPVSQENVSVGTSPSNNVPNEVINDDSVVNNLEEDPEIIEEEPEIEKLEDDNIEVVEEPEVERIPTVEQPVKKTSGGVSPAVIAGVGIAATAAAGVGGAYYLHKKQDSSLDEEGNDYDEDEEEYGIYEEQNNTYDTMSNNDYEPEGSYRAKSNMDIEGGNDNGYQYDIQDDENDDSSSELDIDKLGENEV